MTISQQKINLGNDGELVHSQGNLEEHNHASAVKQTLVRNRFALVRIKYRTDPN